MEIGAERLRAAAHALGQVRFILIIMMLVIDVMVIICVINIVASNVIFFDDMCNQDYQYINNIPSD